MHDCRFRRGTAGRRGDEQRHDQHHGRSKPLWNGLPGRKTDVRTDQGRRRR